MIKRIEAGFENLFFGDFKITEKAPIRAFSWLKALELSYLRHYAKWAVNRHGIGTQTKKS